MSTMFYSKNSFGVGSFPIAFSIITFALQLTQVFLSASSSPRLTVARKTSPSPSPHHPVFIPTPTVPCIPTRTLPSDYPDVPTTARPLLASLVLVMLGMLVFAGSTYIRRKSGTIFTPLVPPSRKEQDPPQPPTPPNPPNPPNSNGDDSSADDKDRGEENGDEDEDDDDDDEDEEDGDNDEDQEDGDGDEDEEDGDGDDEEHGDDENEESRDDEDDSTSSKGDDESDGSSNDEPEDPDDPSGGSNDENPQLPPVNPNSWDILLLGILYLACVITLTGELSSTLLRRISNTLSHRLKIISNQITLNVWKIVDCALVWFDQSLLQLYDEMMWINNERPPRPVIDISMRNLAPKCTPVVLRATDELHELKQTILVKVEKVSQASSTWASKVCPFFRGNDNMQSSRFNDTTPNLTWSRATSSYRPLRDDAVIQMPTATSSVQGILRAATAYGVIGALIQMFRNAHARRARNRPEFVQEGTTLFNENASSAIDGGSGDDENEDPEEDNFLQGPDSVTANERYIYGNNGHGTDDLYLPAAEEPPDTSESGIAYITARSIRTFASVEELRSHESADTSTIAIPFPIVSPLLLHVASPEEWTREDEYCGNVHSSTTTDFINHSINNAPAHMGITHTHQTPFDLRVTLPPPNEYFDEEPENIEVGEEDYRAQEHYTQDEDWHEEVDEDEHHGFHEERECETSFAGTEEYEITEEQGHYVEEEDVYEEEDLYGDEYPGFYYDGDEPGEEECPNDEIPKGDLEETIEQSEPSHRYIGAPETSPEGFQPFSDVEGNANFTMPLGTRTKSKATRRMTVGLFSGDNREAMTSQMAQLERVRQRCIEEQEARLEVAGESVCFPDEPIEGSDISIYFRRRPSSRFQYTEEDSSEGQSAAPTLLTSIPEERLVEMRALVGKAYSSHNYDPSQIDALICWHLGLKEEEDPC